MSSHNRIGGNSNNHMTDDDDQSWSIRDLDHAPEPPASMMHSFLRGDHGNLSSSSHLQFHLLSTSPYGNSNNNNQSNRRLLSSIVAAAKQRMGDPPIAPPMGLHSHSNRPPNVAPGGVVGAGGSNTLNSISTPSSTNLSTGSTGFNTATPQRSNVIGLRDRIWTAPPTPNTALYSSSYQYYPSTTAAAADPFAANTPSSRRLLPAGSAGKPPTQQPRRQRRASLPESPSSYRYNNDNQSSTHSNSAHSKNSQHRRSASQSALPAAAIAAGVSSPTTAAANANNNHSTPVAAPTSAVSPADSSSSLNRQKSQSRRPQRRDSLLKTDVNGPQMTARPQRRDSLLKTDVNGPQMTPRPQRRDSLLKTDANNGSQMTTAATNIDNNQSTSAAAATIVVSPADSASSLTRQKSQSRRPQRPDSFSKNSDSFNGLQMPTLANTSSALLPNDMNASFSGFPSRRVRLNSNTSSSSFQFKQKPRSSLSSIEVDEDGNSDVFDGEENDKDDEDSVGRGSNSMSGAKDKQLYSYYYDDPSNRDGEDPMICSIESYNSLPDDKDDSWNSLDDFIDGAIDREQLDQNQQSQTSVVLRPRNASLDLVGDGGTSSEPNHGKSGEDRPPLAPYPLEDSFANYSFEEQENNNSRKNSLESMEEDDSFDDRDETRKQRRNGGRCHHPTMHQIATVVVTYAPCFWLWFAITSLGGCLLWSIAGGSNSTKGGEIAANRWALLRRQPTDRTILSRLNVLMGFVALVQIGAAVFFTTVTLTPNTRLIRVITNTTEDPLANSTNSSDVWDNNSTEYNDDGVESDDFVNASSFPNNNSKAGGKFFQTEEEQTSGRFFKGRRNVNIWNIGINVNMLGIEAFILVLAALLTVRVVRNVNLVGTIRYLWVLLWILPFQIFFNIGLYDYFGVTDVWVKHYWRDETMVWFRKRFCDPSTSANTLCTVPLGVNETDWCISHYNSTQCSIIKNRAQQDAESFLIAFYYSNASWGLVQICLLVLVVNTLEGIISKPLVRKSRQSNVPAWLSLPIVSCVVFGLVYTYAETSGLSARSKTDANWIGPLYMVTAGLFLLAALVGWYISVSSITNTRHKRNKMIFIGCFILLMMLIAGSLIAVFAASVTFSASFVKLPLTSSERGDLACFMDQAGSCSNCNDLPKGDPNRCPEWSVSDVTKVIQTQAKTSASLAAILLLYAISALRFGWAMRKHIRMYQIQYV